VLPTDGDPFIVFGSVLPWIGSRWNDHPAAKGVAFQASLDAQEADWTQLRARYPDDEFFLLGDLNQDLVEPRFYGSLANRAALETALERSGLTALTGGDQDPVRKNSPECATIDHVCGRKDSHWKVTRTSRWPDAPKPDKSLSDHFGVTVELARPGGR
jgi:endonuclease/exonuclease/phosphatase family metal-dependent hydrolase